MTSCMLPLQIEISSKLFYRHKNRMANANFQVFKKQVYERDNYTCQFCGFQESHLDRMVVVSANHDPDDGRLSNLVTACPLCECAFLNQGQGGEKRGTMIYCPALAQNHLMAFSHVLFCAITMNTGYASAAKSMYRTLKLMKDPVEHVFGQGSSDPQAFSELFENYDVQSWDALMSKSLAPSSHDFLQGIRYLPSRHYFADYIIQSGEAALNELCEDEHDDGNKVQMFSKIDDKSIEHKDSQA